MPLRTEINAIVQGLPGRKTFMYGTAKELNLQADSTNQDLFVCMYPMQPVGINMTVNGSASNEFDIYLEFLYLTKFEKDTEDNEPLVKQALHYINLFMTRLRDFREDINQPTYFNTKDTKGRAFPVFNQLDANTCGMSLTFKVKTRQDEYLLNC